MHKAAPGVGPRHPQVVVLVGATGDLSQRKLLPGLFHLTRYGFIPACRIIGVSLDAIDAEGFRAIALKALRQFSTRPASEAEENAFLEILDYAPLAAGASALKSAVAAAEAALGSETRRIHYLSVPPGAALQAVGLLKEADLTERSRIIMEKPFGVDLESAVSLNARLHEVFSEDQIFRIDHFLGKEPAQNILAFRFANGLFEPIWNRNFIDHVQIDVPETLGLGKRVGFYEQTGAYRDMVVTHLFQILAFMAMEPPTALEPAPISEEKNKVFRSMMPLDPRDVVRGQYNGYRSEEGVDPQSETETFIALKCLIDNWRWAGVPFFLRTGKRLAEGQRIISIAFREPPKSMFPANSGVSAQGPDHLTFDLADASKMSLSFYGKRPGPGMRLDKLSLQFAMHDTGHIGDVLEAYERLILDAMRGDHTLFTTAEGIERLWAVSMPLLEAPPPVRLYEPGSWGPKTIHQLVAPHAWRLPFERAWRDPAAAGVRGRNLDAPARGGHWRARAAAALGLALAPGMGAPTPAAAQTQACDLAPGLEAPVLDADFPDPSVLYESRPEGYAFAYATNAAAPDGRLMNVPASAATTPQLTQWSAPIDALPRLPAWARPGFTWAPSVAHAPGGPYRLYFTARYGFSGRPCVGVAVSDGPLGPFTASDEERPLVCPLSLGGAIDADVFSDADGRDYLLWKTDANCCGGAPGVYIEALTATGLELSAEALNPSGGAPWRLAGAQRLIQRDQSWEGGVIEAPSLVRHAGRYYLFYSGNDYAGDRYAIGVASADAVLGPYLKEAAPVLASSAEGLVGPGGQDVFSGPEGRTWIAFHAWRSGPRRRAFYLGQIDWSGSTPTIVAACRAAPPPTLTPPQDAGGAVPSGGVAP